jgi:chromosome segregation ATPase
MANARREVDLIVKAKDDAVRVLDAITDAINNMVDAQADLTANAKKTSTGIGGLVGAVSDLGKALKGGSNADRLAEDLNKANKAVEALRGGLAQTQSDLSDYSKRAGEAAANTDRLKAALAGTEKQLADQSADLSKAAAAHGKYEAGLKGTEATIKRLTKSIPTLTQKIFDQQAKVEETSAKYEALSRVLTSCSLSA